jgi:tetratricopeptide (TPR) repeat protein
MRKDYDNAEYYYQKALSARKGEKGEEYNLATCAIEREDHLTSKQCLEKILEERPFETSMRFFYGISFLNIGEYEGAEKEFALAYRINPSDFIALFYLRLTREIIDGNTEKLRLLPLKYEKELPEKSLKNTLKS